MRRFLEIDVRPTLRPLLAAAGFAAAISLGEFGATTFLTRSGRETMPIAIARLLGRAGAVPRAEGFAMATLLMVVTAVVVMLADVERSSAHDRMHQ
jgi:thiamine transport system permease protein